MSFSENEYEQLSLLLSHYRSTHALDRAAKHALNLIAADVEDEQLKCNKSNVINFRQTHVSSDDIPIKSLEQTIMGYDILPNTRADEIILSLAADGHIDPTDANHYYRALIAAQTVLDKTNQ
tara:strand:+ start:469 stop:834 length:366 start_codon:yes stop_codon:yes gene_type:complete